MMTDRTQTRDTATATRMFTVEEANGLLPGIRPVVEEMVATFKEIRAEIEETAGKAGLPVGSPDLASHLDERGVAPRLFEKVKGFIEEIHSKGCLVNGPEVGLIDFPALYGSEIVFLCWKFGETGVTHWHRIPDGFEGRRPLLDPSGEGAGIH